MQFTLMINQAKALEWGLNLQQAALFAFLYELPSWATKITIDAEQYCRISNGKICSELPMLTDKPDTAYRIMKQLEEKGLIAIISQKGVSAMVRTTAKGATWNRSTVAEVPSDGGGENRKNIRTSNGSTGKISGENRIFIREEPEKNPDNQSIPISDIPISNNSLSPDKDEKPKSKAKGTRLPEDWRPTRDYLDAAILINKEYGTIYTEDWFRRTAHRFRDYWVAKTGKDATKADWLATWRNWVRRDLENTPTNRARAQHAQRDIADDDTTWFNEAAAYLNGGLQLGADQTDLRVIEGDFSRLDAGHNGP